MANRFIAFRDGAAVYSAEFRERELMELSVTRYAQTVTLGSIYLARIDKIVKSVQAAFVTVPGMEGNWYLPLEKIKAPIVNRTHADGALHAGDEIVVQIEKEAGRNKTVSVVGDFSLTGCYFVVMHGKKGIHKSSKITDESCYEKGRALIGRVVGELFGKSMVSLPFAVMLRTNFAMAEASECERELRLLLKEYQRIVESAHTRRAGTLLRKGLPAYLCALRDSYENNYSELLTDEEGLYEELKQYLEQFRPQLAKSLVFYRDETVGLRALYNMKAHLKELLSERVWLKSGAYLVIQPTEAMTVIDVNSGKATDTKKKDAGLQVNLEAAKEIARQIRLRNLSGIIMVDFIDMKQPEHNKALMEAMADYVSQDKTKTTVIDMTGLHLVEITRQKVRKPFYEQFREVTGEWRETN